MVSRTPFRTGFALLIAPVTFLTVGALGPSGSDNVFESDRGVDGFGGCISRNEVAAYLESRAVGFVMDDHFINRSLDEGGAAAHVLFTGGCLLREELLHRTHKRRLVLLVEHTRQASAAASARAVSHGAIVVVRGPPERPCLVLHCPNEIQVRVVDRVAFGGAARHRRVLGANLAFEVRDPRLEAATGVRS